MITTKNRRDHVQTSRMMAPRIDTSSIFRGWLNVGEASLAICSLEEAAEKTKAEWFVELGVKHAGTSRMIAEVLNAIGRRARLLGVDLDPAARTHWKEQLDGRVGTKCAVEEALFENCRSSGSDATSRVPTGGAAWVLVDACHCRACVEADIAAWADKIAIGGLFLFHDADWRVQLRKPCQAMGHKRLERPGVYDATMNSEVLRSSFHLAQAMEGGTDPKGDYWEGLHVWRRQDRIQ